MKLLLDEMLSPAIARRLRERGHDVVAVKELPDVVGASDDVVLAIARRDGRAVVTNNVRDFRPLGAQAMVPGGPGHLGLILVPSTIRRTRADAQVLADRLEVMLRTHRRSGIDGRELWV